MIEEVQELEVEVLPAGPKGLSAYEVYVKNGGTLSSIEGLRVVKNKELCLKKNKNKY